MNSAPTILVTSAGTASGVNVIRSLRMSGRELRIVATDQDPWAAGLHLADSFAISPSARSAEFAPFLLDLCRREGVAALIPIHSSEIEVVAGLAARLRAQGVGTLLSAPAIVRRCDDKRETGLLAANLGASVPRTYATPPASAIDFPVFVKPNRSSGSKGSGVATTPAELAALISDLEDPLVQQFVEGRECTVDCLVDDLGAILCVSPRWRTRVQGGQSLRGETFHDDSLETTCRKLITGFGVVGPCNLQFLHDGERWVFLEINPRWAAGGLMLTVHAGANLPFAALRCLLGERVEPMAARAGARMTRYMSETIHFAETTP